MKIYNVFNESGYNEDFFSLREAKKAMKKHNAKGTITKLDRGGEWIPLGDIVLTGHNRHYVANSQQTKESY